MHLNFKCIDGLSVCNGFINVFVIDHMLFSYLHILSCDKNCGTRTDTQYIFE